MNKRLVTNILKKIIKENEEYVGSCKVCPAKIFAIIYCAEPWFMDCTEKIEFLLKAIGNSDLIESFRYVNCVKFQKEFLKLKESQRKNIKI